MRVLLIALAATFALAISAPSHANASISSGAPQVAAPSTTVYALQQVPDKQIDININTHRGGGRWYANPMWIAIGALAAIVVLLLVVLAARGGGTTIVKE